MAAPFKIHFRIGLLSLHILVDTSGNLIMIRSQNMEYCQSPKICKKYERVQYNHMPLFYIKIMIFEVEYEYILPCRIFGSIF